MTRFALSLDPVFLLFLVLAFIPLIAEAEAEAEDCGGAGQTPCTIAAAEYIGAKPSRCPAGAFFDLIDGGSCWRCPEGHGRTLVSVKSDRACRRPPRTIHSKARRHGRGSGLFGTDCSSGQFWDPNGHCWSCPGGYGRTTASVTSARACSRRIAARHARAERVATLACPGDSFFDLVRGGSCWRCPAGFGRTLSPVTAGDACATAPLAGLGEAFGRCRAGHVNICGSCRKKGDCGGAGQRPCLIGERLPSCDEELKEEFRTNQCVALRPGETPFTGALSSLTAFYGDGIRALCQQQLGTLRLSPAGDVAIAGNCLADMMTGAGCTWLAGKLGAEYAEGLQILLDAPATAKALEAAVEEAYASDPGCSALTERLTAANRHDPGRGALGTDCPKGQFWDPEGHCWSCPDDLTRTLHPVTGPRACVDKPGNDLARHGCAVVVALGDLLGDSAQCSAEVLQDGVFMERELDWGQASQQLCLTAGEFMFAVYGLLAQPAASPEQRGDKLQGPLQRLKSAIRDSRLYQGAKKAADARDVALSSKELAERMAALPHCR